ncbi:BTB/POZ domain-containing protein 1-like [Pecten maximus]|uniref:BTB/POZ domain-containing protein 1-like n=1 Tax=Pecten maximus TaxID=6579 RepID=UPI001457FF78|nr:BTB/POZ domain-containing protein 1-like [Pecten maximus]
MDNLKEECLRFILENAPDVLQSVTFNDLCLNCLAIITESDDLRHVPERKVYDAVIKWAEEECAERDIKDTAQNKRDVLGEALYNVRFAHIEEEFLFGKICSDKILNSDDIVDLINHRRNKIPLLSDKLNTRKRFGQDLHRIYRIGRVHNQRLEIPEDAGISFQSSADVHLFGFGSFCTAAEPSGVSVKVYEEHVCLLDTFKTLAESQPDSPHIGDVMFDKPIKIRAGKTYTVVELSNKPKAYLLKNGIPKATNKDVTIVFSNTSKGGYTNTNRGQIPYLIISLK